jgi:bifunctional DNA-binding transcriptional regulator/antitoxin component of YhaV-PrlF toxin-antitoxin module
MQSTITARGQTVIPAFIRHQLHLSPADRVADILHAATKGKTKCYGQILAKLALPPLPHRLI